MRSRQNYGFVSRTAEAVMLLLGSGRRPGTDFAGVIVNLSARPSIGVATALGVALATGIVVAGGSPRRGLTSCISCCSRRQSLWGSAMGCDGWVGRRDSRGPARRGGRWALTVGQVQLNRQAVAMMLFGGAFGALTNALLSQVVELRCVPSPALPPGVPYHHERFDGTGYPQGRW